MPQLALSSVATVLVLWFTSTSWRRDEVSAPYTLSSLDGRFLLVSRLNAEQRALVFRRQHIQEPVRSLTDVSDALLQVHQHRLTPEFFPFIIEFDPLNLARSWYATLTEAAHEDVPFPVRK